MGCRVRPFPLLVVASLAVLSEQFVVLGEYFNGTDTEHGGEGSVLGFDVVIVNDVARDHF